MVFWLVGWFVVWVLWHIIQTIQFSISIVFVYTQLNIKTVLFQTIQFGISTVLMSKTVLFQAIQFSMSTQFSSIWPIDRSLSGATTPGQSGLGGNSNEGVLHISQSLGITANSASDCLVSYQNICWVGGSYPSAEMQLVYSTAPADWVSGLLA